MSAFMVSKEHIDALVTAASTPADYHHSNGGLSWYWGEGREHHAMLRYGDCDEQNRVGAMLWAENLKSINARYPDTIDGENIPGPADFSPAEIVIYEFEQLPGNVDPLVVLDALSCYEYQTCEHGDEWRASEAHAFCEYLRDKMIRMIPRKREVWEISDRNIFRTLELAR